MALPISGQGNEMPKEAGKPSQPAKPYPVTDRIQFDEEDKLPRVEVSVSTGEALVRILLDEETARWMRIGGKSLAGIAVLWFVFVLWMAIAMAWPSLPIWP